MLRLDPLYMSKWVYNRAMLVRSDPNDLEAPLKFDRVVDMRLPWSIIIHHISATKRCAVQYSFPVNTAHPFFM